jgi:hypothetical protein
LSAPCFAAGVIANQQRENNPTSGLPSTRIDTSRVDF